MTILGSLVAQAGVAGEAARAGGYQIERSLRFNSADSAYFNRTFGSGNQKTWTLSAWVKRSALGDNQIFSNYTSGTDVAWIYFNSSNELYFQNYEGSNQLELKTTQVFRDVSAWGHLVVALDTTQATSSNRAKLYWNGVQITTLTTATYPSQNADLKINTNGETHEIGKASTTYFNGYLTEINFIDGQALTPSSFGETDTDTGVWKPKKYIGEYGTNGFYLNFSDNSGTTSTTLGKDSSGNGNNWTPNNFSVTAGAGNDSLVDTPTPYGINTGVGGEVRGNYCTLNPLDNGNSNILLTNGNLSVSSSTTWDRGVKGTFGVASGKWYYEYTHGTVNAGTNPAAELGWTKYPSLVNSYLNGGWGSADTYLVQGSDGTKWNNGSGSSYGSAFTTGDVEMCAIDMDNGKVYWGKNGTWFASGDPAAGTNAAFTGLSGTFFPLWYWGLSAGTGGVLISNINFGQRPFAYTAPSGFKALCTQNLPEPTIKDGGDYFNTVLYTGNGSSQTVSGVGFQPDWTWIKQRSGAANHNLYDVLRIVSGDHKRLYSNLNIAEESSTYLGTTNLSAFTSDGFSVGDGSDTNANAATYVAWNWKANGAGVSNTAGTITSTVSVNTTSGFAIVTYTGTGANATVGHGLGVAPSMMLFKNRTSAVEWQVYHASIGNGQYGVLNSTAAFASSGIWQNTTPTSSVFSIGNFTGVNTNTANYVAYCFAAIPGYSAFGSYTGNGSADGPLVHLGFKPAFVLIKSSTLVVGWVVLDAARDSFNVAFKRLNPNSSGTEATNVNAFDMLSNGFKLRTDDNAFNQNAATYIYMAFAENPFKYSLAR